MVFVILRVWVAQRVMVIVARFGISMVFVIVMVSYAYSVVTGVIK
jgi:hypothetical protein